MEVLLSAWTLPVKAGIGYPLDSTLSFFHFVSHLFVSVQKKQAFSYSEILATYMKLERLLGYT